MHRIDTSTAQVDKFGTGKNGFTGGNPQTGVLPTALDADYFDSVQEELAGVIESAGIALNKSSNSQLLAAIKVLVGGGRLLSVKTILASGNYYYSAGTRFIRARGIAGGGGGGGVPATSSTQTGGSQAGFYGQYIDVIIPVSALSASTPVTVGAGGAGAVAGANAGSDGGNTVFGSIFTLGGGKGGSAGTVGTSSIVVGGGYNTGQTLTTTITPINSSNGLTSSNQFVQVTAGTALGFTSTPSPFEGGNYGRGGEGRYNAASSAALAGMLGKSGVIIVEEYA